MELIEIASMYNEDENEDSDEMTHILVKDETWKELKNTTTKARPKPIKKFQTKLLHRRANATKNSLKTQISTQATVIESIKEELSTQNPLDYDITTHRAWGRGPLPSQGAGAG